MVKLSREMYVVTNALYLRLIGSREGHAVRACACMRRVRVRVCVNMWMRDERSLQE